MPVQSNEPRPRYSSLATILRLVADTVHRQKVARTGSGGCVIWDNVPETFNADSFAGSAGNHRRVHASSTAGEAIQAFLPTSTTTPTMPLTRSSASLSTPSNWVYPLMELTRISVSLIFKYSTCPEAVVPPETCSSSFSVRWPVPRSMCSSVMFLPVVSLICFCCSLVSLTVSLLSAMASSFRVAKRSFSETSKIRLTPRR